MTNAQTNDSWFRYAIVRYALFLKDWLKSLVACVRPPMITPSSHY